MDKINVNLYGGKGIFGGRETPLEADEIYCDKYQNCSFYKENKCLRCRSFMSPVCRFGRNTVIKGYTSRAAKYYTFKRKYEEDTLYNKLSYPKELVALIDNYLFIYTNYVDVRERTDRDESWRRDINGFIIGDCGFGNNYCFIPLEKITNELLFRIFEYRPRSLFGNGEIKDWKEKRVSEILQTMKKVVPDIYSNFIKEYSQYEFEPDYIGKRVYINSLKPGTLFTNNQGRWEYDGEYVTSLDEINIGTGSPWWLQGGTKAQNVKIKVNDRMLIEVNDNSIVNDNVRFE